MTRGAGTRQSGAVIQKRRLMSALKPSDPRGRREPRRLVPQGGRRYGRSWIRSRFGEPSGRTPTFAARSARKTESGRPAACPPATFAFK